MTLRERQSLFARLVAEFVPKLNAIGYEVTFGEAHRPEWVAKIYSKQGKGSARSLHIERLAVDLNLFRGGVFLTDAKDYSDAGALWKSLHPDNRWGGDIVRLRDANHFSNTYDNRI